MSTSKVGAPVLVTWLDSTTVSGSGWQDRREAIADGIKFSGEPLIACGFLIAKTQAVVVLSLVYNHHTDDVGVVMAIPVRTIVSITYLTGVKGSAVPAGIAAAAKA